MISKEFIKIIDDLDKKVKDYYGDNNLSFKEMIYGKTIKLQEEVWELSGEVLAHFWSQRKEKLQNKKNDELSMEFADVLLATLLLAKNLDVDINDSLTKKLELINKRLSK